VIRFWNLPLQYHLHADDAQHLRYGVAFAETGRFEWTVGRPGYALLLGALIKLTGFQAVDGMVLSGIFGVLAVGLTWLWARRSFGQGVAMVAAAFMAFTAYAVFLSKITNPIGVGVALQAAVGVLLARVAGAGEIGARWTRGQLWCVLAAGLVSGFCVSIHPSFASGPVLALGFVVLVSLVTRRIRSGVFAAGLFVTAVGVTVLLWEAVYRLRPPVSGANRYIREMLNVFEHQRNWRAVAAPEPWDYFPQVFSVIEGPWWLTLVAASLLFGGFRCTRRDWRFLAPTWFAVTSIAIAVVNVGTGGVAIPRAVAMAWPALAVLIGAFLVGLVASAVPRFDSHWRPRLVAIAALLALLPSIPYTGDVVLARTGILPALQLMQQDNGFMAAQEFDPWVPATSASNIALVGEKQSRQPVEESERLVNDHSRACFAALSGFVEVRGRILILGNAEPESETFPAPVAVFRHDAVTLAPAVLESFAGLGILTLTTRPTPELRLYRESYLCDELGR
jgi:hypothetical protein